MDKESKERPAFAKRQAGGTFVTYAQTNFDSLDERPFGAVDSLVLSWLSYYRLPGRLLREVPGIASWKGAPVGELLRAEYFEEMLGNSWDPDGGRDLLFAVCANPRFRGMRIAGYRTAFDDATEEQFAAATFLLPDGSSYIAFRGTDSTLVGWKEDFNMAFQYPVPAQATAADYLARVAALWKDVPIVLTGHSKGGNLAVYAAMNASDEVKDRVERIYSLDGPGFPESVVNSFEYASVSDRIVKIVPDSSVVGMVLETPERCMVVKSDVEGIMQHFAFSWQMHGGEFDKVEDVANSSVTFNKALNGWLSNLSKEQRERAVDALFAVLEASGAGSISAMMAAGPKVIPEMLGTYVGLSVEDRRNLNQALGIMLQAALARNPKVRRR